jgi:hypothetical protein
MPQTDPSGWTPLATVRVDPAVAADALPDAMSIHGMPSHEDARTYNVTVRVGDTHRTVGFFAAGLIQEEFDFDRSDLVPLIPNAKASVSLYSTVDGGIVIVVESSGALPARREPFALTP